MTVISAGTADDSGMYPMRWRAPTGSSAMSTPSTTTLPVVGRRYPVMTRMVVVFPAPLGPRSPSTSPCSTSKLTSAMAWVLPKRRPTPTTWTPAVTCAAPLRPVVGRARAHPFGIAKTGRDGRFDREGLSLVGPVHDREAVARRWRRGVDRLVVVRSGETVEGVAAEVVQPAHEALPREIDPHGLGRVLELEAH